VPGRTALILMAAGASERMGEPKQLLEFRGETLLRHAAKVATGSVCQRVFVVLGSSAERMRPELSDLPAEIVENARWAEGMGTTIGVGVRAARAADLDAVILALADQPLVTSQVFNRIVSAHRSTGLPIIASQYSGTVGVPVLFANEFYDALLALEAAQGCKELILKHAAKAMRLDCPEAAIDIDTPAEYRALT